MLLSLHATLSFSVSFSHSHILLVIVVFCAHFSLIVSYCRFVSLGSPRARVAALVNSRGLLRAVNLDYTLYVRRETMCRSRET